MTMYKENVTEKATYQKIKDYVKSKYGVNVHTKYIAEAKRKHEGRCITHRIKWMN